VINGHPWSQDTSWLLAPIVAAVVMTVVALVVAPRAMTLEGGAQR